jgi:hypothetical protein
MTESDLETRVSSHLRVVADTIPAMPPCPFSADRTRKAPSRHSRRWHLGTSLGLTAALTAGGAGIAAASGAFSGPASRTLQQLTSGQGSGSQAAARAAAAAAAASGMAATPSPSASSATTLPSPSDLGQEVFRVTNPGPEGTTISVWSERTGSESGCLATVESAAGQSADSGSKPPTPAGGSCNGGVGIPSSVAYTYGMNSHIWVSPSGATYQIVAGELSEAATRVVFKFDDGTTLDATAVGGFFALGVPNDRYMGGGTVTAYSPSGTVLFQGPVE